MHHQLVVYLLVEGHQRGPLNIIDFITISTLGNAADFGDLTSTKFGLAAGSNSIRGLFAGGENPSKSNIIDYVSIPTLGNAVDFGNLTSARDTRGMLLHHQLVLHLQEEVSPLQS